MTLLTGRQIAHFHTLGFVRIPSALRPREVDEFAMHFDAVIASDGAQNDDSEAGQRIFPQGHRVIVPLIEADPFFYNLLDHPNLASIADDLLGEDCIFYGSSDGQIHCGDTNWHRDGQTPLPAIDAKLTFYLDDIAPGKGCLSVIPGSHHWPLDCIDLEQQVDAPVLGYNVRQLPGRYDLGYSKGDVIAFNTRIWHSSWGGSPNRRQMAWMMRTAPHEAWEFDRIVQFNKDYARMWSPQTGRLISDRFFETANAQRMKKIAVLKDLGV